MVSLECSEKAKPPGLVTNLIEKGSSFSCELLKHWHLIFVSLINACSGDIYDGFMLSEFWLRRPFFLQSPFSEYCGKCCEWIIVIKADNESGEHANAFRGVGKAGHGRTWQWQNMTWSKRDALAVPLKQRRCLRVLRLTRNHVSVQFPCCLIFTWFSISPGLGQREFFICLWKLCRVHLFILSDKVLIDRLVNLSTLNKLYNVCNFHQNQLLLPF